MDSQDMVFAAGRLQATAESLLRAAGVPGSDAHLVADSLVEANLRGVDSHGVQQLPVYLQRIRLGLVELSPTFPLLSETDSTALIDGQNALGQVAAMRAMDLAIQKAEYSGIGLVGVRGTNHCGMLAYFTLRATQNAMVGWACCNAPVVMAPWGGKDKLIANNPLCVAIPTAQELPIVLDMATSVAAKSRIYLAQSKGERIPDGWALDKHGIPTNDPTAALDSGMLLPMGGPKGYGLAVIIDILAGLMTGSAFGAGVGSLHHELGRGMNVGLLVGALKVESFLPLRDFQHLVDGYIRRIRESAPATGFTRVCLPGEPELETKARRAQDGIPVPPTVWQALVSMGRELGTRV